jgi:hypothetical protein
MLLAEKNGDLTYYVWLYNTGLKADLLKTGQHNNAEALPSQARH